MNRQQNRAVRSILRRAARARVQDPFAILGAFSAARARGWAGPDTRKATTYRVHLKYVDGTESRKTDTGYTKVWTPRKAARFAKYRQTLSPYPKDGAHARGES
jgi:hypothetical protein